MVAMFPPIALVSPLFVLFDRLGIVDTYAALILPYTVFSLPLGTWILAAYFAELPRQIEEAALVDGCSPAQVLFKVLLPLAGPGWSRRASSSSSIAGTSSSSPSRSQRRTLPARFR
jgi:multiple sugar transport system permease protein